MVNNENHYYDRGDNQSNNLENKQSSTNHINFTHIPKGIKEKLNLPIKNSTYLKKMINTKAQQANKKDNHNISKSNYESNVFPVYNTNLQNFKRSFSIHDSKRQNKDFSENSNSNNMNNFKNSGINYYTGNNIANYNPKNQRGSNKQNLGNSLNNQVRNNNNSRSKSNGKSKNIIRDPMMNLIRTYTGKSRSRENPATYRKYRAQTKSTDKLYQNITNYPIHLNPEDSVDNDYYNSNLYSNQNDARGNPNRTNPYPVNEVNVNLSKYNDYEFYQNVSLQNNKNKNYNYKPYSNGYSNNKGENSNTKMKKSFNVLSDILDSHFSVNAGNQPKINLLQGGENDMRNGENKLNLSNFNSNNQNNMNSQVFNYPNSKKLENQNLNLSQNKENLSGRDFYKDKIYSQNEEQNTKLTINLSYLGENPPDRFLESLEHIMTILDPIFDRFNLNQKLEKFIENVDDHRRSIRLGSLVGIYIILKKYQIDDSYKVTILEKIISLLHNYETQEELFLVACLEIAG